MNESQTDLKNEFRDQEYREAYAEDFLNTSIATQLQVIREQRKLTQAQLAEKIGTQQAGVSRIENVNYSSWKIETLKKLAFALGCRLKVSIETFGSLIDEETNFSRETLKRPSFDEDPVFHPHVKTGHKVTTPSLYSIYAAGARARKREQQKRQEPIVPIVVTTPTGYISEHFTIKDTYDLNWSSPLHDTAPVKPTNLAQH
jgi:transcriptional regulator with XRE-family HTH domain